MMKGTRALQWVQTADLSTDLFSGVLVALNVRRHSVQVRMK